MALELYTAVDETVHLCTDISQLGVTWGDCASRFAMGVCVPRVSTIVFRRLLTAR